MDRISEKMKSLLIQNLNNNVEVNFCESDTDRELHIKDSDVLITFTNGISSEWLAKAENCKFIQKLGAGVNNIAIEDASKRGIPVANTRGLNSKSVAEHAVLLMLSVYKHLTNAHSSLVDRGQWLKTELRDFSYELSNKKIGLIGIGNIGSEVVKLLKGFNCEIIYSDVFQLPAEREKELGVRFDELDRIFKEADVISLHVPLNKETHYLVNKDRLEAMKPTSIVINTCRGGVIDEVALYEALKENRILGAGLDVFEQEPLSPEHKLVSLKNVVLTPHIGGGTVEAMSNIAAKAGKNISSYLEGGMFFDESDIVNLKDLFSKNL